jgi:hypothetical protein
MPQTMTPWRWGDAGWLGGVPVTFPLVACVPAVVTCVCTVRATATVASRATTAAAAEMNLILRDIIFCTSRIRRVHEGNNKNFALHKTKVPHIKLFSAINRFLEYCTANNRQWSHGLHSGFAE